MAMNLSPSFLLPNLEELEVRQLLSTTGLVSNVSLFVPVQPVQVSLAQQTHGVSAPTARAGVSGHQPLQSPVEFVKVAEVRLNTNGSIGFALVAPQSYFPLIILWQTQDPFGPGGALRTSREGAQTSNPGSVAQTERDPSTQAQVPAAFSLPGPSLPRALESDSGLESGFGGSLNQIPSPVALVTPPSGNPTSNPVQTQGATTPSPTVLFSLVLASPNGNPLVTNTTPSLGLFGSQSGLPFGSAIQQAVFIRPGELFTDVIGANVIKSGIHNPLLSGGGGDIDGHLDARATPPPAGIVPIELESAPGKGEQEESTQGVIPLGDQETLLPDSAAVPCTAMTAALDRAFVQLGRDLASTLDSLPLSPWLTSLILTATVLEWARRRWVRGQWHEEETAPCWRVFQWEAA